MYTGILIRTTDTEEQGGKTYIHEETATEQHSGSDSHDEHSGSATVQTPRRSRGPALASIGH